MKACPLCKKSDNVTHVIYAGFPMWFCADFRCHCMFGFWSFVMQILPYNGILYFYTGCSYPRALWSWLKGEEL